MRKIKIMISPELNSQWWESLQRPELSLSFFACNQTFLYRVPSGALSKQNTSNFAISQASDYY